MRFGLRVAHWVARALLILLLVIIGTNLLVRYAPGYLTDEREMDARYASGARAELSIEAAQSSSLIRMTTSEMEGWMHGSGGVSRQYGVPVSELILPRLAVSGRLLLCALPIAWFLAASGSICASLGRKPSLIWHAPAALLLAIPTAALATLCLLIEHGGPVLVMALLLAARDFKFLQRTLRASWLEPHLLHARALGIPTGRLLWSHVLPDIAPRLAALIPLSIVTALSAIVPVEVIFNVEGIGQLAWNAAMNRDLPVLLGATMIMALAVIVSGTVANREDQSSEWNRA